MDTLVKALRNYKACTGTNGAKRRKFKRIVNVCSFTVDGVQVYNLKQKQKQMKQFRRLSRKLKTNTNINYMF